MANISCSLRRASAWATLRKEVNGVPESSLRNSCRCSLRTSTRQTVERVSRYWISRHSTAEATTGATHKKAANQAEGLILDANMSLRPMGGRGCTGFYGWVSCWGRSSRIDAQETFDFVQTCISGDGTPSSSITPSGMPRNCGRAVGSYQRGEPHELQKTLQPMPESYLPMP